MDQLPKTFKCDKCNAQFKRQAHLMQHLNRKNPCIINGAIEFIENKCIYCKRTYSTKFNLTKHIKICKMKNGGVDVLPDNIRIDEKLRIMEEEREKEKAEREELRKINEEARIKAEQNHEKLEHEIAELKALLMEKLSAPPPPTTINNITNNNGVVNNNNIVNCYINPNIKYLEEARDPMLKMVNLHGVQLPFHIIDAIWFNKQHPENHSIRYIKGNTCQVQGYLGEETKDITEVARDVRAAAHDISSELIQKISDKKEHREYAMNIRNNKCFEDATTDKEIEVVKGKIVSGSKNIK